MAVVPLQAVFRGDFVTLLVLVDDKDTMEVVARKIAHHVINRRLPPQDAPIRVQYNHRALPPDQTVAQAGILPLSFVEVYYDARDRRHAGMDCRSHPG
jgi:toluene monooxygenase system protein B